MSPHDITASLQRRQLTGLQIVLLTSFLIVGGVGIVSSTAHSAQDNSVDERTFENTVPAHVPVKVKLKKEQVFKNMKNKSWDRDLEIEVKNTGNKPIYFLYMLLVLPDVTIDGYPYALQVTYGRKELIKLTTPIQLDDVPILPGESATLTISENQVKAYEGSRDKEKRADPKKVRLDMQLINFGDGTGLRGTDGRPMPNPARKQSSRIPYVRAGANTGPPSLRIHGTESSSKSSKLFDYLTPANFVRVNFFSVKQYARSLFSRITARFMRLPKYFQLLFWRTRLCELYM
jgi:hypothetical protein